MPRTRKLDPASKRRVPPNQINPNETSTRMSRTADFTGVGEYKTIAGGDYEAEPTEYEWKAPKNENGKAAINPATGKPYEYANMKWVIRSETDDEGNDVEGHVIFNTYSENPKSLFALKRDAIALGEDPEAFDSSVDLDAILGAMKGRVGIVSVVVDSYTKPDGTVRMSNKITKVEPLSSVPTTVSARR